MRANHPTRCEDCRKRKRWRRYRVCEACHRKRQAEGLKRWWKRRKVRKRIIAEAVETSASGPVDLVAIMADLDRAEAKALEAAKRAAERFKKK